MIPSPKPTFMSFNASAFFALLMSFSALTLAALTPPQQMAKERGIMLYNQLKPAEKELRIAAEAGDAEAQFYLGEELRHQKNYMTSEARQFFEASAAQGYVYSMIRLGNNGSGLCQKMGNCKDGVKTPLDWLRDAWQVSKDRIAKGDVEATYTMYLTTYNLEALRRSAEAGYPYAQYLLAIKYEDGDGFFWLPWQRSQQVERWFKAAAENGIPQAMVKYAVIIYENHGDLAIARHWIEESAKTGYDNAIGHLGAEYAHERKYFGFPLDLVKGYGLMSLLLVLDGGGGTLMYTQDSLAKMAAQMTPEQIEQGKAFAEDWKSKNPRPISFFPMTLDPLDSF
ncbi:tetratricopeptide repeat protein [Pseudomonas sp. PDM25]|uniref:tetratricopeptide repeat protein n=1 Tax=Pseudomonas sp. PDM25 TaxID=2854772 RepID=UPI001C45FFBF|nr:sel1 repeat family protein [Pseudomonas sp. PDM25]MBV7515836.1 sel1 repeat family protein [Pseudomonas sp. PDM25]